MEFSDEEMIAISALQHAVFCMRQCALIHLENIWTENALTAAGRAMHDRVDANVHETRRDVHVATTLRLVSRCLGIAGVADMVEFHRGTSAAEGVVLPGLSGRWIPFPVEYKHGKPNGRNADEVQLCAQALCLEEMLNTPVPTGALFYGKTRHRVDVPFDENLRTLTKDTICRVREMLSRGTIPEPNYNAWCKSCSLLEDCRPNLARRSARDWLAQQLETLT